MTRSFRASVAMAAMAVFVIVAAFLAQDARHRRAIASSDQRLMALGARVDSLGQALGALAVAHTDNAAADARLYTIVHDLRVALQRNARLDRARFDVTTSALSGR